jgi:hypothetical protein
MTMPTLTPAVKCCEHVAEHYPELGRLAGKLRLSLSANRLPPLGDSAITRAPGPIKLGPQFSGDLAAVFGKLDHHLLMKPDIHRRRIVHVSAVMQFLGKVFPRGETAVEI